MKEQLNELVGLLRQSEVRRKEVEKELKLREQAVAIALATSASVRQLYYVDVVYNPSFNEVNAYKMSDYEGEDLQRAMNRVKYVFEFLNH